MPATPHLALRGTPAGPGGSASADAPPHAREAAAVARDLGVDPARGLSADEVTARLAATGPNRLRETPPRPAWLVFADQLRSGLFLILLVAAVLAALVGDLKDAAIIAVVMLLNATIGFAQERKATRSLAALRQLLVPMTTVRREGAPATVPSADVVPGDVVVLDAGSRVPADGRLLAAHDVAVDQSSLTGESEPVAKTVRAVAAATPLADRADLLHAGTVVVRGRAELLVTATGMTTEVGRIAGLLAETPPPRTPLQRQLDLAGRRIALIGVVAVVLYSGAALWRGDPWEDIMLRGVALAVAAVPEGLPAVLALVLALGVHRMAAHGAIVRRLASVETLGSATVICTDKTGTLTRNRMTVREVVPAGSLLAQGDLRGDPRDEPWRACGDQAEDRRRLLTAFVRCSDAGGAGEELVGDPMETALHLAAAAEGLDPVAVVAAAPRLAEQPFAAEQKYMATVHRLGDGRLELLAKGAPDVLLPRCVHVWSRGGPVPLDDATRAALLAAVEDEASRGRRVLAAASAPVDLPEDGWETARLLDASDGLVFLGLAGIADPPRREAGDAVALCHRAGIDVKMVTGDHVATAAAIAAEVGIPGRAVTGEELEAMSAAELAAAIDDIGVFARVTPAHKVAIVAALTARGHVTAMTGDGQNDAAAVRAAHVGVAMGRTGTDVTKEAADLVLTDDNFATIVRAVQQGRGIYDNILKFIRLQLTTNIAAILTFVVAVVAGPAAPMTAVQVLWVNLITDGPPALALGLDRPDRRTMSRRPRSPDERILSLPRLARLTMTAAVMAAGTLGALAATDHRYGTPYATTFAFTTFVLFQVVNALNVRTEDVSALSRSLPVNPVLLGSLALVVTLQVLAVELPVAQGLFGTVALEPVHWAAAAVIASLALVVGEVDRAVRRHRAARRPRAADPPRREAADG